MLKKVNEERSLLNEIWQQKQRWIGHVLRHDSFLQGIFEDRMLGKRTRGRRRTQMLHDLTGNSDYVTRKQTAAERIMWRYSRGISRTCSTADDWRKEVLSARSNTVMCNYFELTKIQWPTGSVLLNKILQMTYLITQAPESLSMLLSSVSSVQQSVSNDDNISLSLSTQRHTHTYTQIWAKKVNH